MILNILLILCSLIVVLGFLSLGIVMIKCGWEDREWVILGGGVVWVALWMGFGLTCLIAIQNTDTSVKERPQYEIIER